MKNRLMLRNQGVAEKAVKVSSWLRILFANQNLAPGLRRSSLTCMAAKPKSGRRKKVVSLAIVHLYQFDLTIAHALKEIKHYQKDNGIIFPRAPFGRLFREIMEDYHRGPPLRVSASAMACAQQVVEIMLCTWFELL